MDPLTAIQLFDTWFLQMLQSTATPALTQIMLFITFFGSPILWVLIVAAVYWMGREDESFYLMNIILFSALLVSFFKPIVGRLRPDPNQFNVISNDFYTSFSFPSGHATLISGFYGYLKPYLKLGQKNIFWALIAGVTLSRVYLGVHYLTDVIAGIALGLVIGKAIFLSQSRIVKIVFKLKKWQDDLVSVVFVVGALLALNYFGDVPMIAILFGFYFGYFISKQFELFTKTVEGDILIKKQVIGFIGMLAIMAPVPFLPEIPQSTPFTFFLFFMAGTWISLFYPLWYEKFLKKRLR